MDEIEKRLRDTADQCIAIYNTWRTAENDAQHRENLQEAIHELRKVSSRLEIEIAVSERAEMNRKPIDIPPHRASRSRVQQQVEEEDSDDNVGNSADHQSSNHSSGGGKGGGSGKTLRISRRKSGGKQG